MAYCKINRDQEAMKIGYACNKFNNYPMKLQVKTLKEYGCEKIYKCSEFLDLTYEIKPKDIMVIFHITVLGSVAEIMMAAKLVEIKKIELISIT
jgi:hypothetical protein